MHSWQEQAPKIPEYPEGTQSVEQAVQFDQMLEQQGRLQKGMASFFIPAQHKVRGVCLLEHGATAGPYQYWELAKKLSLEGYHVYAPRLPGHGLLKDGQPDASDLPKSRDYWRYGAAAKAHVQALEPLLKMHPLYLIGFSAGAMMSLHAFGQYKERVEKIILVAPYFAPKDNVARLMLQVAQALDFGGRIGLALDKKPHHWLEADRPKALAWGRPGHYDFFAGNLFAVDKAKCEAVKKLGRIDKPLLLIISEGDSQINSGLAFDFYRQHHGRQLLQFAKARNVPHAMLSPMENPDNESREEIHQTIINFLNRE